MLVHVLIPYQQPENTSQTEAAPIPSFRIEGFRVLGDHNLNELTPFHGNNVAAFIRTLHHAGACPYTLNPKPALGSWKKHRKP